MKKKSVCDTALNVAVTTNKTFECEKRKENDEEEKRNKIEKKRDGTENDSASRISIFYLFLQRILDGDGEVVVVGEGRVREGRGEEEERASEVEAETEKLMRWLNWLAAAGVVGGCKRAPVQAATAPKLQWASVGRLSFSRRWCQQTKQLIQNKIEEK